MQSTPLIAAANDAANGDGLPNTVLIDIIAAIRIITAHLTKECSFSFILSFDTVLSIYTSFRKIKTRKSKTGYTVILLFQVNVFCRNKEP